jgi:hypothetical protein
MNESLINLTNKCLGYGIGDYTITEATIKHGYDIVARFEHWNKELFNNEIPLPSVVKWVSSRTSGGKVTYKVIRRDGTYFDIELHLTGNLKRSEQGFDKLLIHEMTHLWMLVQYPTRQEWSKYLSADGHGKHFEDKIKQLSKKCGFDVPLKDGLDDLELDKKSVDFVVACTQDNVPKYFAVYKSGTLEGEFGDHLKRLATKVGRVNRLRIYIGQDDNEHLGILKVSRFNGKSNSVSLQSIPDKYSSELKHLVDVGTELKID